MKCKVAPIETGLGEITVLAAEVVNAIYIMGGGAQQSNTVKVMFLVTSNGLVEFVIFTPCLISLKILPLGNASLK